jgi:hypothetical protein
MMQNGMNPNMIQNQYLNQYDNNLTGGDSKKKKIYKIKMKETRN